MIYTYYYENCRRRPYIMIESENNGGQWSLDGLGFLICVID